MKTDILTYFDMNNLNIFTTQYFTLIIVALFILLLLITLLFMIKIENKILSRSASSENSEKYLKLIASLREVIEETRKQSFITLTKANEESISVLRDSIAFSENMKDLIKKKSEIIKRNYLIELKKNSSDLTKQFQEEYKKEFLKGTSDLKQNNTLVNKRIMEEAEGLIIDIHNHLNSNHDMIIKKIDDDMTKTEEFLIQYRKNKVEEFDKEFKSMTNFYVRDYLKRTLSFDEHEEIIRNIMKDFEKSIK